MSTIPTDISLDATRFDPEKISEETKKINGFLETATTKGPRWHEVGVEKYRQMRETGETPLPVPVYLPEAKDAEFPARDPGRTIPVRVYAPDDGKPSKGIILHMHGGGFVLATHKHQDATLQRYANTCHLTAISIGYRLAPENPFPAAIHDCIDAALHLADHGMSQFAAPLRFLIGESAGANLVAVTAFHLLRARPDLDLAGLVFPFGHFDLTLNLPSVAGFERPLVISREVLERFVEAYTPGMTVEERRNPLVSPLYEDFGIRGERTVKLPPALFLCGTEDPLLDDTLLMGTKWAAGGGEAVVKVWPGAPHGFTAFPGFGPATEGVRVALEFVREKLDKAVGA
ncbi:Alpha/Beta hydrolase protein [Schizothecium vesticola]|uniref:Alpha/Beta hydrolase protein n=1 Tax=Schizothecium vesticola TaxID=314040 RepID=A0AA40BRB2_9PEZI|nr:Alpha/Beta hydrolase protein [Schizothecium vesticola]